MFMGEYSHTIDAKGRLIVPAKFREQLGEAFVVAKGNDGCLNIYTSEEWESLLEKLRKLPNNKNSRVYARSIVGMSEMLEADKQGRVLIPARMREHAGLNKDVVFAGVIDKVEVWSKERWDEMTSVDNLDEIAEEMAEFGLCI